MKVKFIEKAKNTVGTFYAIAQLPNGKFGVYILKHNYNGQVKGGIMSRWCLCLKNADEEFAREYFQKKLKGKYRA